MVTLVKTTIHTVRTAGIPIRRLERSKKERKNIKYKGSIVVLKGRVRRHSQSSVSRVSCVLGFQCRVCIGHCICKHMIASLPCNDRAHPAQTSRPQTEAHGHHTTELRGFRNSKEGAQARVPLTVDHTHQTPHIDTHTACLSQMFVSAHIL